MPITIKEKSQFSMFEEKKGNSEQDENDIVKPTTNYSSNALRLAMRGVNVKNK